MITAPIASAPVSRQGSARCARRLMPPLTATVAPAQQAVSSCLSQLLRSLTTGSDTKFLTAPSALRAPSLQVAPGVVEAAAEHIALLLPRLRLVHSQRQRCGVRIDALLDELQAVDEQNGKPKQHSDVAILRSLPGVGRIVAATIIAEACVALTERNYHALRGHAGIAPVTKQSGKQRLVLMRYACNGRLRHAFYHCARVAAIRDLPSRNYYTALRQRGHTHGRALRAVADRLLRILIAMLTTRALFDRSKAATRGVETPSEKIA